MLFTGNRKIFLQVACIGTNMSATKRHFVLVAIASLIAVSTMTLAPMNLKATTDEDNNDDDRDDGPALTMTRESTNPSGHKVKEIQSDEHSERAAVVREIDTDHEVNTDKDDDDERDDPALTLERVRIDEDGTVNEETKVSNEKSSKSASSAIQDLEHVIDSIRGS